MCARLLLRGIGRLGRVRAILEPLSSSSKPSSKPKEKPVLPRLGERIPRGILRSEPSARCPFVLSALRERLVLALEPRDEIVRGREAVRVEEARLERDFIFVSS